MSTPDEDSEALAVFLAQRSREAHEQQLRSDAAQQRHTRRIIAITAGIVLIVIVIALIVLATT